jgi:hypothetical protein
MDILYEPQNATGCRGDWCFDWVCPNQECPEEDFVDGGGVFPGSFVKVECHKCGTIQFIYASYNGWILNCGPPLTSDYKVLKINRKICMKQG